jgi:hypothetical protein
MRRRRIPRSRPSLVIQAAEGNLFNEKTKRPPRIVPTLRRQVTRDLTDIGRGMLFLGPRRRRLRRRR